jgi:FMN phosphatase YigB (HAD superfamily)
MNRVVTFDVLGTLFSLTTPPRLRSIGLYEPRHASLRSRTAARSRRRRSLEHAKLHDRFERVFSVSDVGAFKPDRRPYEYVVGARGGACDAAEVLLAAG